MTISVTQAVSKLDASQRYPTIKELGSLEQYYQDGRDRLSIVKCFSTNSSALVSDAIRALLARNPKLIASNGLLEDQRFLATFMRELDYILRYVTYALISGDKRMLDNTLLNGLRETYSSLGIPLDLAISAVTLLENECRTNIAHIDAKNDLINELDEYFDSIRSSLK